MREFRELLAADAALMLGVAEAPDVAAALQRYWARREQAGVTFEAELRRIAQLPEEALARVRGEVDRLLGLAGGDARLALTRHGGLDRSIHLALGREDGGLTAALSVLGVAIRAPLRELARERYVGFEPSGVGGMGIVYAALDTEMNRRVAFKMVRPHAERGEAEETPPHPLEASRPGKDTPESEVFEQLKARLVQEAWVTGGLEHPGIVPVYEIGQTPTGIPYYTMRFVRGERTLADAIREKRGAPFEERLSLLEPFLKVCDALGYAHDKGVVHRDLKPANVALGQYGEVVLLDWGLARIEGKEDVASSGWQQQVARMRQDAGFHTMEGGAIGTAGYMSPEAAQGRLSEVDRQSDVYGLGAMLFEILTGRLCYQFRSFAEYASLLLRKDPPAAREVDSSVPEALSALCERALSREKADRPGTAEALAGVVRAWQTESAVEREVEGLLREARSALSSAERLEGSARLEQVDRAAVALGQVEAKRPGRAGARGLGARLAGLREAGIRERERASALRVLRRAGVGALAVLAVAAFVVVTVVEGKRREAEEARVATEAALGEAARERDAKAAALVREQEATGRAEREASEKAAALVEAERERNEKAAALDEKARALDDVLRLADSKRVRDLVDGVERLWPLDPSLAGAMAEWLGEAGAVLGNREGHRQRLAALREGALAYTEEEQERDHAGERAGIEAARGRLEALDVEAEGLEGEEAEERRQALGARALREEIARLEAGLGERRTWRFADPQVEWQHQVLLDLLVGLDRLDGGGSGEGLVARVGRRHGFVRALAARSLEERADLWRRTIEGIAASPRYGGQRLAPQLGLVPLGPDPASGLFEFAHVGSGTIPTRDETTQHLVYADDAAVVLVLIPGGTFRMGAQPSDPDAPHYDPGAEGDESPVHEVTLSPYFLAKHEVTQAQWREMTEGLDPSLYKAGQTVGGKAVTPRNPVEQVSWEDVTLWLSRNRLVLPTEAQWECGCRAGTETPWITGQEVAALGQVANIRDRYSKENGGPPSWSYTEEVEDGHAVHAPVGSFAANAFGLHDVHGNVWEWCRDVYAFDAYRRGPTTDPLVQRGSGLRVYRGGSWRGVAGNARSAYRSGLDPPPRPCGAGRGRRPPAVGFSGWVIWQDGGKA
jgi:formylglycine-generating enzyme required for sulfatase activity/serine/threonine protein kinase